jgi:uncharacterized membrane protein YgcG
MNVRSMTQSQQQSKPIFAPVTKGLLQRKCACGGAAGLDGECAACRNKRLQRRSTNRAEPNMLPPIVHEVLRSPGQPLDPATRAFFEPRFGHDFSRVRVHTDAQAAKSTRAMNALAYTVGQNVVFGADQYAPGIATGKSLLAHELSHVIQQQKSSDRCALPPRLEVSHSNDSSEREADTVAARISSGEPIQVQAALNTNITLKPRGETKSEKTNDEKKTENETKKAEELKTKLDQIEQRYRKMIESARAKRYNVAADNLEKFLKGTGGVEKIDVTWLRGFAAVTDAERDNQERFENSLTKKAKEMKDGATESFNDYWDRMFTASTFTELYYASGTSTIRSTGSFKLTRNGNVITIEGTVKHHWFDPYDWHAGLTADIPGFGTVSDEDALLLQKHRGAKSFDMEADWEQTVTGKVVIRKWWFDSESYEWKGPSGAKSAEGATSSGGAGGEGGATGSEGGGGSEGAGGTESGG